MCINKHLSQGCSYRCPYPADNEGILIQIHAFDTGSGILIQIQALAVKLLLNGLFVKGLFAMMKD